MTESEMQPYPLDSVVGALLVAMAEAQHLSDEYTNKLRTTYQGQNDLNMLRLPNAQLGDVEVVLPVAVAAIIDGRRQPQPPRRKKKAKKAAGDEEPDPLPDPDMEVYVQAEDLAQLPPNVITTLTLKLSVDDAEVLEVPKE